MAIVRLAANVNEARVNAPLLKPYLGSDVMRFLANDHRSPTAAGYGGTSSPNDFGRPLRVGAYDGLVGLDDDNWFTGGFSTGSWWIFMSSGSVVNTQKGDSGGALAVFKTSESRWYQIGVVSQSINRILAQEERDLFSPTFNNGDGNGTWIAQFLDDADDDQVSDSLDNCAPTDTRLLKCQGHISACSNPTQADSDGDGVGDACDNCPDDSNSQQLDRDRDSYGDACDGCPNRVTSTTDADGDDVWDECDNCNLPNPYAACSSNADCGPGICRENDRCSIQIDDEDGDLVGGRCDRCEFINSRRFDNSNSLAEQRKVASALQDICDPVPIYVAEPFEEEVIAGIFPDPDANERNLLNNLTFGATAQIGHNATGLTTPKLPSELARQTYSGRVGFRYCSCNVAGVGTLPETQCRAERCPIEPGEYGVPDTEGPWKRLTVATHASEVPPLSTDLSRGAELNRLYSSDLTFSGLDARIGEEEGLFWSFWKDFTSSEQGGRVPSAIVGGVRQTNGLFWSHTIGEGFPSASPRDAAENNELRDVYELVHAPFFRRWAPRPPPEINCGSRCPWFDPRAWKIFVRPEDQPDPRINDFFGRDITRLWAGLGGLAIQRGGSFFDLPDVVNPAVRTELSRQNTRWATPVEGTLDRVARNASTIFASIESPWTGNRPIREFVAAPGGRIALRPAPEAGALRPSARVGAQAVLSALERSVYLIGGSETGPDGVLIPQAEVWRYSLDSGVWETIGVEGKLAGAALTGVVAASYDVGANRLYVLGKTQTNTPFSVKQALLLTSIDTHAGTARVLMTLPALAAVSRVSLGVTEDHSLVLAWQKNATTIQLYEIDPTPARPNLVGYAALTGQLDEGLFVPDDLQIPSVVGGVPRIQTVTRAVLKLKTGLGSAGDQDKDGVPDAIDDCPAAHNPEQQGCTDQEQAVLYASASLVLADRVETVGNPLLVAAGNGLTRIGVDARIGTLRSLGPVDLRDRARARGSIASGGTVTLGNGAGADGGIRSNVSVGLDSLSSFAVTFPAPGPAVMLEPDQRRDLLPGSYSSVHVKSRSTLTLVGGEYFFESLTIEPQASLVIDSSESPVRIYVKSGLIFRGAMLDHEGGMPKVLLAYFGTSNGLVESSFDGTLVAPKAKLVLASVPHSGAFYAKELEVQAGARIEHVPLKVQWLPGFNG